MAEVRKFLFDNFVLDREKHSPKVGTVEEEKNTEKIIEAEPIEENNYDQPVSYTQEELDEKIREAEKRGYQEALQTAEVSADSRIAATLVEINDKLKTIMDNSGQINKDLERQFIEMSKTIMTQLIPSLTEEHAIEIVNKFASDNFSDLKREAKLSFYVHPDIIAAIQENISKLANANDFEGKITIHKDASLGIADARVMWDTGGVENSTSGLVKKVNDLLEDTVK